MELTDQLASNSEISLPHYFWDSGILEIIGVCLMLRRQKKKKHLKTKTKNKVQFRILLSRKKRDMGVGVHQAIPGRDCR